MITQRELELYRHAKDWVAQAEAEYQAARKDLIARFSEGVEGGALSLKVEAREYSRFSYDGMVDAIGRLQADRIKALLPLSPTTFVTVSGPTSNGST